MQQAILHRWDLPVSEAQALQVQLAQRVVARTTFEPSTVRTVAGVDVSYKAGMARAAVVVLGVPGLQPIDCAVAQVPVTFPYVPGLLAFREGPAVLQALQSLTTWPDLFIFDAQGVAHPRRLGLAAHLGVILDAPSIGCAKSKLMGCHDRPGDHTGDWVVLRDGDQVIGAALRTAAGRRPVYVSVGHRIDLETAVEWVLRCCIGHRLPESTRCAHRLAGNMESRHGLSTTGPARC
jgi:deoxyribonuclease V